MAGRIERAKAGLDAFNRGDLDEIERLSTDDLRIVPMRAALEDIEYSGPRAVRDFWEEIANEWSELEMDMGEFSEEGERVVARGVLRGTARASGAKVEMRVTSTCTFRGELIAEIRTAPQE